MYCINDDYLSFNYKYIYKGNFWIKTNGYYNDFVKKFPFYCDEWGLGKINCALRVWYDIWNQF